LAAVVETVLPWPLESALGLVVLVVVVTQESTHHLEMPVVLVLLVRQDKVTTVEPPQTMTAVALVVVAILPLVNQTRGLEVETQVKV
jgi:type III secretory pathway component EscR